MLVISRKTEESIVIDDKIVIKIVSVGSEKVTLGIEAPREISVMRQELYDAIKENQASAEAEAGMHHGEMSKEVAAGLASVIKEKGSSLSGQGSASGRGLDISSVVGGKNQR